MISREARQILFDREWRYPDCSGGLRLFLNPWTPEINIEFGIGRRGLAGQALTRQEGHGFLKGRILAVAGTVDQRPWQNGLRGRHSGLRHARHGICAKRLDAGLFHGFEYGAGVFSLGPVFAMNLVGVIGEPEGKAVGEPRVMAMSFGVN